MSIVIACGGVSALAQTQVDLQAQFKKVDFSAAASTKPMKMGATLPATCSTGELFFNTSSPAGSNVYGCVFTNTRALQETLPTPGANGSLLSMGASSVIWVPLGGDVTGAPDTVTVRSLQSRPVATSAPLTGQALVWNGSAWKPRTVVTGQGTVQMQADGTLVGTRGTLNFVSNLGLLNTFADTLSRLDIQQNVDTVVIETRANRQTGASLLCTSAGAWATTYTCATTPALAAYRTGMVLHWQPDVSAVGVATALNVDSLRAKSVKLPDGTTDPRAGDLVAGGLYNLWYDGANFRLMFSPGMSESAPASRPAGDATRRGRLWMFLGASGAKDELAVCAKAPITRTRGERSTEKRRPFPESPGLVWFLPLMLSRRVRPDEDAFFLQPKVLSGQAPERPVVDSSRVERSDQPERGLKSPPCVAGNKVGRNESERCSHVIVSAERCLRGPSRRRQRTTLARPALPAAS